MGMGNKKPGIMPAQCIQRYSAILSAADSMLASHTDLRMLWLTVVTLGGQERSCDWQRPSEAFAGQGGGAATGAGRATHLGHENAVRSSQSRC